MPPKSRCIAAATATATREMRMVVLVQEPTWSLGKNDTNFPIQKSSFVKSPDKFGLKAAIEKPKTGNMEKRSKEAKNPLESPKALKQGPKGQICKMAKAQKGSKRMPSPRCIVPKGIKVHLTMSKKTQKRGEKSQKG